MSMHPVLTTSIYIILGVVFATFVVGMILYTRKIKPGQVTQNLKGRPPLDKEEGILLATRKNEGRSGTPQ